MEGPAKNRMTNSKSRSVVLLTNLAAVGALIVFSGTFFAHTPGYQPTGYAPMVAGSLGFMILMFGVNFAATPQKPMSTRLLQSIGLALVETVVFVLVLLFLLANSFGS